MALSKSPLYGGLQGCPILTLCGMAASELPALRGGEPTMELGEEDTHIPEKWTPVGMW